uniref:Uncharacterized protein n=1 Tax=Rhabditophanes sp. KR3021 TaxID=114890 RepID=A0AC35UA43_9BILA
MPPHMPPHMPFGRPMMPQIPFNGPMSNNGPMSPIPFGRPMPPMPSGTPMPPMPFNRPMLPTMPFMPFGRPMPNNGPMVGTKITIPNIPTPSKVIAPEEDKNVIVIEKPNIDIDKKNDEDRLPTPPPYNDEKKFEMQNDFEGRNDRVNFFKLPALFLTREKIREYRKRSDGFEPSNREEFGNNRQSRFPFSKQMKRHNRRNNEQQDMRRDFNRNSFQARDNFGKFNNNNMKPQFDAPNFGDVLPILRERVY